MCKLLNDIKKDFPFITEIIFGQIEYVAGERIYLVIKNDIYIKIELFDIILFSRYESGLYTNLEYKDLFNKIEHILKQGNVFKKYQRKYKLKEIFNDLFE